MIEGSEKWPLLLQKGSSIKEEDAEEDHDHDDDEQDEVLEPPPPPPPPPLKETHRKFYHGSLDFERVINDYSIQANRDRWLEYQQEEANYFDDEEPPQFTWKRKPKTSLLGYTGRTATRWALSVLAGVLTGFATVFIVDITEILVDWRSRRLDHLIIQKEHSAWSVYVIFTVTCSILAFLSSLLCVFWVPSAAGSGIPEVKAYLNGVRVERFNSMKLFLVKVVGTILSVASSLTIGMEGPLIHIGAIVGASCSNLSGILSTILTSGNSLTSRHIVWRNLWLWNSSDLAHFANDAERRDLISIGASCGFAASFGAPIGGLLFILDDISSYFDKQMFLRTLVANALGTFCLAWHRGDLSDYTVISLGLYRERFQTVFVNRFEEVPFYILIGVAGGIMGGLFCRGFENIRGIISRRFTSRRAQLLQVLLLSLVTSTCLFWLPNVDWACNDPPDMLEVEKVSGRRFFCPEGQINELATILFGSRIIAIRRILTDPTQFQPRTLFVVGILFYLLMLFTLASTLPTGVFTPSILSGAALGGAVGQLLAKVDTGITPSTFALLGVAAMLAGLQRSTVSICVILVEATGQTKVLIPVIVTVIVARYVAFLVHPEGLYETSMRLKGYPYLDHGEKKRYDIFEVSLIMSTPVITVKAREKASRLVKLLQRHGHHGFPVVEKGTGKFLGLIRRKQIVALLECGVFDFNQEFDTDSANNSPGIFHNKNSSTPYRGVGKEPLMHFAYHIKDDRYDYLEDGSHLDLEDDAFENNAFLLSVRGTTAIAKSINLDDNVGRVAVLGDDAFPQLSSLLQSFRKLHTAESSRSLEIDSLTTTERNKVHSAPAGFATVGQDRSGNVVVTSLNPEFLNRYVNLAAVMNKGTFCVPSDFPISKAHSLFTQLGLRWIVVLGGISGGEVVGMLTRCSFSKSHIRDRTGTEI